MLVSIPCFCSASHARMPSHVEAICRASESQAIESLPGNISLHLPRSTFDQERAKLQVVRHIPELSGDDGNPTNRILCKAPHWQAHTRVKAEWL